MRLPRPAFGGTCNDRLLSSFGSVSRDKRHAELSASDRGFTIVELIVALFLVSLITAAVIPSFAGFGERAQKTEAREMASILRYVHDNAIARKETYRITFDFGDDVVRWSGPDGEKKKRLSSLSRVMTESTGFVSRGSVTVFAGPLGFRETVSVHFDAQDGGMTVTLNSLSGKVKIRGKDER